MSGIKFEKPKRLHSANIQAEFYRKCRMLDLRICLEYKHDDCRFDAVAIDDDDNIVAIVEFKSYSAKFRQPHYTPNYNTKQITKYKKFGVPVFIVGRMNQVEYIIYKIVDLLKSQKNEK